MIKLFRNIRKNLLMENKTSKYLKYAIGEIILVVIGILIALQINNWNEKRKDKAQMRTNINSIKEELKSDVIEFRTIDEMLKRQMEAGRLIIPVMESKNHVVLDSLAFILAFNSMNATTSLIKSENTWDLLNSSGIVSEFKDSTLKLMLRDYYRDYQILSDGINNSANPVRLEIRKLKYELFTDTEHRKFFPTDAPIAPNKKSFEAIFENEKVLPKCRFIASTASYFDGTVDSIRNKGNRIIDYIDNHYQ
jgi:hypothetical protein